MSDTTDDVEEVLAHADTLEDAVDELEELSEEDVIREAILNRGPPPRSWDQRDLRYFEAHIHEGEIKRLAAGLDREEVLNYYGLTEGLLDDYDQYFFDICFIRGRMEAKHDAVKSLFKQMNDGRGGVQASLTYLGRFANSFQGETGEGSAPKAIRIEVVD